MAGRYDHKQDGPDAQQLQQQQQQQEQDQEQEQQQSQETEQSRAQNQLGNQALAAMLANRAEGTSGGDGGGGTGQGVRSGRDTEKEGVDYGGDDDIVDDVPISLEDLTRSWNPTTKKSEDRPRFVEPMPDDDLPPEDPRWLAAVVSSPSTGPLPRITGIDALLQPSPEVVAASIAGWARAAARWSTPSPGWRALAWLVARSAPLLQASEARVLPARSAIAALGACVLLDSPAVRSRPASLELGALLQFCLELEGRAHRVDNILAELADQASKLPRAAGLVGARLHGTGRVRPQELPAGASAALTEALGQLARWQALEPTVPDLDDVPEPEPDPDDPLGLDAILAAETGGAPDPQEAVYKAALAHAERLASAASHTRITWSAVAVLVDEVACLWTTSPAPMLLQLAKRLDEEVDKTLQLLLEVARACQKRSFPPRALRNGLKRSARMLDSLRAQLDELFVSLIGGILPGPVEVPIRPRLRPDPLTVAIEGGVPLEALPWVETLPDDVDTDAARLALLVLGGAPPARIAELAAALHTRAMTRPGPLATVATLLHAHASLHLGDHARVHDLAEGLAAVGRARRNGLLVAEAALLSMEASAAEDDLDTAEETRLRAGRLCWELDSRGALSLLARWTPPPADESDYAPFFDYPMDVGGDEEDA